MGGQQKVNAYRSTLSGVRDSAARINSAVAGKQVI